MNHNDKINFNGKKITIENLLKKPSKEILIGLYIKTHDLESSTKSVCKKIDTINAEIGNQWKNIGKNKTAVGWIKGVLFVIIPVILYIVYNMAITR